MHSLGTGEVRGELLLGLDDDVAPEADLVLGGADVPLPADQAEVRVTYKGFVRTLLGDALPADDHVHVVAARGHGHSQLRRLTLDVDGQAVLDLDRYDPRIQPRYLLADPLPVPLDGVLTLTCTYDNSPRARQQARDYGEDAEMCGGWVYVVAPG